MIHIHNGDSSANIARQSTIPGEHFAWREALIDGPAPARMEGAKWREVRAKHLAESNEVDVEKCERELLDQEQTLARFAEHDEVVLWFEHDLFCQTNLLYLLDWFAQRDLGKTKISLICIGEFPGKPSFRGLGELNAEQMASLFPSRHELSNAEFRLATTAWQAYRSPDPTAIEDLLASDTSALPFLGRAFQRHLARFPSLRNGLGRIEETGLELIHNGFKTFMDLFSRFGVAEPVYGLGDSQFSLALRRLSDAKAPLITRGNGDSQQLSPEEMHRTTFEITKSGEAVLGGNADFVELNGLDIWLGGVHLAGKEYFWRWDEESHRLVNV